jgi:hypothetical protein
MAHFAYPAGTPTGVVPANYVLPSTDWQTNIGQVFKAINGDDGGTWAPGAFITVGGSGFEFTGTGHSLAASARLNVESTGEIRLKAGALLRVDGSSGDIRLEVSSNVATLTAQSGSEVYLAGATLVQDQMTLMSTANGGPGSILVQTDAGITFQSGSGLILSDGSTTSFAGDTLVTSTGAVTFQNSSSLTSGASAFAQWSGTWWFAGECVFVGGTWPKLAGDRSWTRRSMDIALCTHNNGDTNGSPDDPDIWVETSDIANTPILRTRSATTSDNQSIIEFRDLPEGGEVTEIEVISKGSGTAITAVPTYRFIRWQTGDANMSHLSAITTDVHTTANFTASTDTTTITPSSSTTIDRTYRYGLLITHPYDAGGCSARFYDIVITGTSDSIRI